MSWQVGQQAIINRKTIVTVERVTPTGRVVADGRTFGADGRERSKDEYWKRANMLEPLTDEIQAEMDLVERGRTASSNAVYVMDQADKWLRQAFGTWGGRIPNAADVDKAERLTAAIQQVMGSAGE